MGRKPSKGKKKEQFEKRAELKRKFMAREKDLVGQVTLVTGAARGIGKAISLSLAAAGASVVLVDINQDEGRKVSSEIARSGGSVLFIACDLKNEKDVVAMVNKTMEEFSRIDILVNNAGIGYFASLLETPTKVWEEIMAVNLRGTFLCSKYVAPHMITQKSGRIINISSAIGKQPRPLMAAHAVSKAGIIALTVALAKEVAEHGITVNAICPGFVDTPVWDDSRGKLAQFIEERQIIKIPIKCEDVASMAYWLASSDTAKLVTGQALSLDGGIVFPTY